MLRNYFKIAIRNLNKHRLFSSINIGGLAIGLACSLFILLYVRHELSYDRFYQNANRIYRVAMERTYPTNIAYWAAIPPAVGKGIADNFPEVEQVTRFLRDRSGVQYGNKKFNENDIFFADDNFFEVFALPFVEGNPANALQDPNSIVMTKSTAEKYFGRQEPLGKVVSFNDTTSFVVSGVIQDLPPNSHFHCNLIVPMAALRFNRMDEWANFFSFYTYLELREDARPEMLEEKLPIVVTRHIAKEFENEESYEKWASGGNGYRYFLQPITDIHLHSNMRREIEANGDTKYIYIFSVIAGFIVLLACINFMNLTTARSVNRAKEVGVRRVLGSVRRQLIGQFLTESILVCFLAMVVAILIVELLMPIFYDFLGKQVSMHSLWHGRMVFGLLGLTLTIGLFAGGYPAFFLSAFHPISVLKGKLSSASGNPTLRNILVVLQFVVSITLMIGTAIVYQQMSFMQNKKLGFDKEHVLIIKNVRQLGDHKEAFKQELLKNPNISNAALSSEALENIAGASTYRPKENPDDIVINMAVLSGDTDFIQTMDMKLREGRNFRSGDYVDHPTNVILNETAVRQLGWTNGGVNGELLDLNDRTLKVIGVISDFNFESLHKEVRPLILLPQKNWVNVVNARILSNDVPAVLSYVKQKWNAFSAGDPLEYSFLDEDLTRLYQSEERTARLFVTFSLLAILIACLGLFGLSAYTTEQRNKEIGVRKVLGATSFNIVRLLSKEVVKLMLIAVVLAWPISYFAMTFWLQNFAYRVALQPASFMLAGIMALVIALLTVSTQAIRAAIANPVDSLRYE